MKQTTYKKLKHNKKSKRITKRNKKREKKRHTKRKKGGGFMDKIKSKGMDYAKTKGENYAKSKGIDVEKGMDYAKSKGIDVEKGMDYAKSKGIDVEKGMDLANKYGVMDKLKSANPLDKKYLDDANFKNFKPNKLMDIAQSKGVNINRGLNIATEMGVVDKNKLTQSLVGLDGLGDVLKDINEQKRIACEYGLDVDTYIYETNKDFERKGIHLAVTRQRLLDEYGGQLKGMGIDVEQLIDSIINSSYKCEIKKDNVQNPNMNS
jgi:hypothetical protein